MSADVAILVVDDRPADLLAIESVLACESYRLVRATSGPDALRRVLEEDFAVILVDVVMPGMDGFEVAQVIKQRERSRDTPIIFLSADGSNLDVIYRGYSAGAVDYLVKPLDPDVLRAKVAIFVELLRKDRRIRAQAQALRAFEQQRYRNLAEAIPQIVWTADERGAIGYFNRRWYEYTGQAPRDATGAGWLAALARDDADRVAAVWQSGIAAGAVFELECRVVRDGGAAGWHLCRAVPELDDGGRVIGWLGTFTDCDALKRACETAERAVHARDEFLSIASHELKTPVTTLQLRLDSMRHDATAGEIAAIARKLESCRRQTGRLAGLVESMFDLSRIASGKLELHRERAELGSLAREVVERLSELAARSGATLAIEVDDAVVGRWDRQRVEQVVENLVANAIKYAPDGPIAVRVRGRGEVATIEVADRGPGIAPAELASIFSPFVRATSSASCGGLGLGLYIARELARAHGGSIDVASEVGAGTTFVVELPRT